MLTDNGQEFTDRLFASRAREPSDQHVFDRACQQFDIEHRLIKPRTPRTNGMVERFNGRIADVLKTHRFNGQEDLTQTLHRYVQLYNHELPQSALHSRTPIQAMRDWYDQKPELFNKKPVVSTAKKSASNRPGCEIARVQRLHRLRRQGFVISVAYKRRSKQSGGLVQRCLKVELNMASIILIRCPCARGR